MDLHNCYHEKKEKVYLIFINKEWIDFIKYMY